MRDLFRFDGLEDCDALGNDATEIFLVLRVRGGGLRFCIRCAPHGWRWTVVVERQRAEGKVREAPAVIWSEKGESSAGKVYG